MQLDFCEGGGKDAEEEGVVRLRYRCSMVLLAFYCEISSDTFTYLFGVSIAFESCGEHYDTRNLGEPPENLKLCPKILSHFSREEPKSIALFRPH